MAEPLLEIRDLSVAYVHERGSLCAVDGVSLDVWPGEILGLAGESGSGKSTLAKALLRILSPPAIITGGTARFQGQDIMSMDATALRAFRWRRMAMVVQSAMNALNPVRTVGAQLLDTLAAHERLPAAEARARAVGCLERVDLTAAHMDSFPHELSGGMRQRVVIAMAVLLEPQMLIMDEPTTALDVLVQREILRHIQALRERLGFAVLFITHDLPLMLDLADRVGILYAGRLVEVGPTETLRRQARHPYTQGLLRSFPSLSGDNDALEGIPGTPPDLNDPPPGCRFHPRCDAALPSCSEATPPLVTLGDRHQAACPVLNPGQSTEM